MDVQSKERLTGAVILVVLVVLVVPELLRGPRRAAEPQVPANSEGPPTRHYTIELGERSAIRPAQPKAPPATQPTAAAPVPDTSEVESPVAPERRAEASTPAASTPPVREAAAPPAPAVRPAVGSPPASGWSLQVGSFAIRENAEREVGTLRKQGFRSFLTEGTGSGGKRLYHVRVGPEADRASAQALAERLKSSGRTRSFLVPYP